MPSCFEKYHNLIVPLMYAFIKRNLPIPQRLRCTARSLYRKWNPPFTLEPFERLFPDAEKRYHAGSTIVQTPELLKLPLWSQAAHLKAGTYTTPEDFSAMLENVLYCPINSVVVTDRRQAVAEMVDQRTLRDVPAFDGEVKSISGVCAALRSPAPSYYHVLVDRLPRIMALDRQPYKDLNEIKLLSPGGLTKLEAFYLERLLPPNVRVVDIATQGLYRLEHFLFTSFKTRRFAGYIPEPYLRRLRETFLPSRPSKHRHRIYISRANQAHRRIENSDELTSALEKIGFQSIIPEDLTLEKEIELFYDAEVVVGAHGSGITNVIFSDRIKVLELFPTRFMVPNFYFLCKALGHQYGLILGTGVDRYPPSSHVDVGAVVAFLERMGVS